MSDNQKRPAPPPEGMPDPETVVEAQEFVSPKGMRYTILKTTEMDPKDKRPAKKGTNQK